MVICPFASGLSKGKRVNRRRDWLRRFNRDGDRPHLHYELRVDWCCRRDPTKVVLPTAPPIAKRDWNTFQKETQSLAARLNIMRSIHLAHWEYIRIRVDWQFVLIELPIAWIEPLIDIISRYARKILGITVLNIASCQARAWMCGMPLWLISAQTCPFCCKLSSVV